MNYAAIKKTDVANGPGIRVSLFVSGCTHGCKGCFNREAWDFGYGQEYKEQTQNEILQALAPEYIRGLSLLGGEPLEPQNRGTVLSLVEKVRQCYPHKDIWCYTGYDYEKDLLQWAAREAAGAQAAGGMGQALRRIAADAGAAWEAFSEPEDICSGTVTRLLSLIDVLVDGAFVEEKKNLRLAFRGSENQRIIDLQESARQGSTVLLM